MKSLKTLIKKKNNAGMTLVEVIVAVAILSFAILPLMYTFVYTTRFNAKSREQQRATSAAEAIVEKYKAYPLTQIDDAFDSGSFSIGEDSLNCASVFSPEKAGADSVYKMRGVNFESGSSDNRTTYDAVVTVHTYDNDPQYNGTVFELNRPNFDTDAVYVGIEDLDKQAYSNVKRIIEEEWNNQNPEGGANFPEDKIIFKRNLTFTINEKKVTRRLVYTAEVTPFPFKDKEGNNKNFDKYSGMNYISLGAGSNGVDYEADLGYTDGVFFNSSSPVKKLYIMYTPMYTTYSGDNWVDGDSIVINNDSGNAIDVYLYKQRSYSIDLKDVFTYESNTDNSKRTEIRFKSGNVNLYHNLGINIGEKDSTTAMTDNGINLNDILISDGGTYTDQTSAGTPSVITRADLLSDINVKIYAKGSLKADGSLEANARLLTEINGTFGGKN